MALTTLQPPHQGGKTARRATLPRGALALVACALAVLIASAFLQPARAFADEAPDDVPRSVSGSCYIGETWMVGEQSFFTIPSFSGQLSGATPISSFECIDHTAAAPEYVDAWYEASLVDCSLSEGWVEYYVVITPPDVTDGVTYNEYGLVGYQRVGGSVRLAWDFKGGIALQKQSALPSVTEQNGCYSLEGAAYGVFATQEEAGTHDASQALAVMRADADGAWQTGMDFTAGTYYVSETQPPAGYALDAAVYAVEVTPSQVAYVNAEAGSVQDAPRTNPVAIWATKRDAGTEAGAQGAATLEGALFTVRYYDGYYDAASLPSSPTRTWVVRTGQDGIAYADDEHKVSGDEYYRLADSSVTIPLGTVTVEETEPPKGYLPDTGGLRVIQIEDDGVSETLDAYEAPIFADTVMRGDFSFSKVDGLSGKRMTSVPFSVTSHTTGERHIIVTDENGMVSTASSWNAHTERTNANDDAVSEDGGALTVDEHALDSSAGVWFGGRTDEPAAADDQLGALPFDTYTVSELRTSANEGMGLVTFDVVVSRNGANLDLGTVVDNECSITTEMADSADGDHTASCQAEVTLVDAVSYSGLVPGEEYAVVGTLHVRGDDGEDAGAALDEQGNEITATTSFIAEKQQGRVDVTFTFTAPDLEGKEVVAFEQLLRQGAVYASHADIDSAEQTVALTTPEEPAPEEPVAEEPPSDVADEKPQPEKPAQATKGASALPKTGDSLPWPLLALIPAGALGLLGASLAVRRLQRESRITVPRGKHGSVRRL